MTEDRKGFDPLFAPLRKTSWAEIIPELSQGQTMKNLTSIEKRAITMAANCMGALGIEIKLPWDGDLNDLERERYTTLLTACRIYADVMRGRR